VCTPAPGGNCIDPIINATATGFTIQNNRNGSGTIEPGITIVDAMSWGNVTRGERITYAIVGTSLQRQESTVDVTPQTILINVSQGSVGGVPQPYFQYLDAGGNVLATPITNPSVNQSNIRTVIVNFQVGNQQGTVPASWRDGSIRVAVSEFA
jgi:hypothetical protein